MSTASNPYEGTFATAAVPITSTSAYVLVDTILIPAGLRGRPMIILGTVGSAGALNGLQMTEAITPGGTHVTTKTDADFNTPDSQMVQCSYTCANPPYQTPLSTSFWLKFASAPAEFAIYAKKATADVTLQISGTVLR
jgi:hypothetical protein